MRDSVHEQIIVDTNMATQSPNTPKRRTYSAEFKALLVKEATDSGRSVASIAREHGINQNLLHNWKRQYPPCVRIVVTPNNQVKGGNKQGNGCLGLLIGITWSISTVSLDL